MSTSGIEFPGPRQFHTGNHRRCFAAAIVLRRIRVRLSTVRSSRGAKTIPNSFRRGTAVLIITIILLLLFRTRSFYASSVKLLRVRTLETWLRTTRRFILLTFCLTGRFIPRERTLNYVHDVSCIIFTQYTRRLKLPTTYRRIIYDSRTRPFCFSMYSKRLCNRFGRRNRFVIFFTPKVCAVISIIFTIDHATIQRPVFFGFPCSFVLRRVSGTCRLIVIQPSLRYRRKKFYPKANLHFTFKRDGRNTF